jgi:hypothetical protein
MISAMSLIVVLVVAAPVPKGAEADAAVVEPTGPAPRLCFLKTDSSGKILVPVPRTVPYQAVDNGKVVTKYMAVQEAFDLLTLKNAITTWSGDPVEPKVAYRKLQAGGYVAISSDGKAVSAGYLRALNRGVLIFASPTLALRPDPTPKKE